MKTAKKVRRYDDRLRGTIKRLIHVTRDGGLRWSFTFHLKRPRIRLSFYTVIERILQGGKILVGHSHPFRMDGNGLKYRLGFYDL